MSQLLTAPDNRRNRMMMQQALNVLGIESSCDDTGAAVLRCAGEAGEILSNVVLGQDALHAAFGGVVPEIAARAHAEKIDIAISEALKTAGMALSEIDLVAATAGPGLIGGVLAGVMSGKAIAAARRVPFVGVNHLAGHALTPRLTDRVAFPYLMLLVSGGHCQFLAVLGPDSFRRLGGTIDDAPGEAFDKSARLLGLGFPGGPAVEAAASTGDTGRFFLPRPLLDRPGCDMSFSGLKTALRRQRDLLITDGAMAAQDRADLCAGFQAAVADVLAEKSRRALAAFAEISGQTATHFAVAGGVAANQTLRRALERVAEVAGATLLAPPLSLCTDNAAMIAWAGYEAFETRGADPLTLPARPRWPLDQDAAAMLGSGKKGAKA